jgi:Concanavalin A-like lectin/glucanases superfamily
MNLRKMKPNSSQLLAFFTFLVAIFSLSQAHADLIICNNWSVNGNPNPPGGVQLIGARRVNANNDPSAVTLLQDVSHINNGIIFQSLNQAIDGLNVQFAVDFHDVGAADGMSFNYAPYASQYLSEKGNTNGLACQFIVDTYTGGNYGTINIYFKNQLIDTFQFNSTNALVLDSNSHNGGCWCFSKFYLTVRPDGFLQWHLDILDNSCSIIFSTGQRTQNLGANPFSDPSWQAYFGGRSGNGKVWCELNGIDIRGFDFPKLNGLPASITANQDQSSGTNSFTISSSDNTWPAPGVIAQAYADNSTLLPANNINIQRNGANGTLSIHGAPGAYGTTTMYLQVIYPSAFYTNVYPVSVTINQDIPPTINTPASLTLEQGKGFAMPFTYGSQQWPLFPSIILTTVEIPGANGSLLQSNSLQVGGNIPGSPGTAQLTAPLYATLNKTGQTQVKFTVTDGSGIQSSSVVVVSVVNSSNTPVVAGERTALSFNENSLIPEYGQQLNAHDLALGSVFTIEAWVRPSAYPSDRNSIVSFGTGSGTGTLAMFALQSNGLPQFLGNFNDAHPSDGPVVPLNAWTHVAVTVAKQVVTFYINGQPFPSIVLNAVPSVSDGGSLLVGLNPVDVTTFQGQIDEVRA